MTINRLATRQVEVGSRESLTALEWAGEALQYGKADKARAWLVEARNRGEIGCARFIQWDASGQKRTIRTFPAV